MKKTISILLAAVMLLCCVPFTVFAAGEPETFATCVLAEDFRMQSGKTYIIPENVTVTVPIGLTLDVPAGAKLLVEQGGTLKVLESLIVLNGGLLQCDGFIEGTGSIETRGSGAAKVQFRFPSLAAASNDLSNKLTVNCFYVEDGVEKTVNASQETSFYVPLKSMVRMCVHIVEDFERDASLSPRDKFDDSLLDVRFNNVPLSYKEGYYYKTDLPAKIEKQPDTGYFYTTATTGGDISYGRWTNDSDFLTTKRIVLPSGEGYECVSRYPVSKTEDGAIVVKYGDPFSFKVELDEAYDMSSIQVYIFNGYGWLNLVDENNESPTRLDAKPDDYGYYNISEVNTDLTVTVTGVMKNSTINLIGNLLDTFRNIFNMLKEFFEGIQELFNGG